MNFELSNTHLLLKSMVKEFVDHDILPIVRDYDSDEKFLPPIKKMAEMGLFGICFPQKYGGGGMDYLSLAIVCEELERGDSSLRVLISVHTGLVSGAIYQWGTEKQKEDFLPSLFRGEKIGAFGLTEPCCGSDVGNIRTRARKQGDNYILNGEKTWISLANTANCFLIVARTDEEKSGVRGLSAFLVDRNYEGIETTVIKGKLGLHSIDTGSITLKDVTVPEENLLGLEGEGFKIAMSAIDNGRFTVAAGALGIIRASIEASKKYCHERTIYGKELGRLQLIQDHLAYMQASYDISELLVRKVAWLKNIGRRNTRETSMAKWIATTRALDAVDRAIQIHGAYGYTNDFHLERMWRNARSACILEGTNEVHKLIQAAYVLGYRKDKPLRCEMPPFNDE